MKYTKEETKRAMKVAMKARKRYAKELNCKFNEVSLSICLKEAYTMIAIEKQYEEQVKQVVKKSSIIFDQNEISAFKDGWKHMYNVCEEFGYEIKPTGMEKFTHKINCSRSDFETIKEMIREA